MRNFIILLLVFYSFYSCTTSNREDLEIEFLTDSLVTYTIKSDYNNEYIKNRVRFRIKNNSAKNYLLNLYCLNEYKEGCSYETSFPEKLSGLDLNNLIIENIITTEQLEVGYYLATEPIIITKNRLFNDSLINKKYYEFGYKDENWNMKNRHLTNNILYLKSNEVLYFETYVDLPKNGKFKQYINPLESEQYKASILINSDSTSVKDYLMWQELKYIQENNYELYHGKLQSNSIPLIIKNE